MRYELRPLTEADIEAGAWELSTLVGWNQQPSDWRRVISDSPDGCFKVVDAGRVIGTVTTTRYGRQVAWIGMMLVHPDYRRRGLATQLMMAAIEYLRGCGVATIRLDATPLGRPLYEKIGFRADGTWSRWKAESVAEVPSGDRFPKLQPWRPELLQIDRQAFGVDRGAMLQRLAEDGLAIDGITGYAMLRPGRIASQMGPVVATGPQVAGRLVREILQGQPGPFIWDVNGANPAAIELAQSLGFSPFRELERMTLGEPVPPEQQEWVYAFADPAIG